MNNFTKGIFSTYWIVICAVVALAVACASTAVKRDTIKFSHHKHSEEGLECGDCHGEINQDAEKKVQAIMTMNGCADCHDVEDDEQCGVCHSNIDDPQTYEQRVPSHLKFSHQLHEERSGDCADCHRNTVHAPSTTSKPMPAHLECNTCHQEDMDKGKCNLCHDRLDLYDRKPQTIYSHEKDFFAKHGVKAASNEQTCSVCHDQAYCMDCHNKNAQVRPSVRHFEQVDRQFMHSGDWMSKHSFEARAGKSTCLKCHGNSRCSGCHERQGVGAAMGGGSPHPPRNVWLAPGAQSHSRAARRNISECATCHDQGAASNCVTCHRSGGVNPHPPGWKAPVPTNERGSHKMCRICHVN